MTNLELIGQIHYSKFKYYDARSDELKFKQRPVLIIGVEKEYGPCDLTVLPVSSISKKENIVPRFDVEIPRSHYPLVGLSDKYPISYCRTSKVSTVSSFDVGTKILCQLNEAYPNLYELIKNQHNEFQKTLF